MKKYYQRIGMLLLLSWGLCVRGQEPGFHLAGTVSLPVPVTASKMTNLVFPVAVAAGVKVSRDVLAQKPTGINNVIELKAVTRNFTPTNLSVYGVDGRLYSFDLHYTEDTNILNYRVVPDEKAMLPPPISMDGAGSILLSGLPADMTALNRDATLLSHKRGFLHRSAGAEGMEFRLKGVYLRDSLLWLCLDLRNRTMIRFQPGYLRVFVEDRHRIKRMASQEVSLPVVYSEGVSFLDGNSVRNIALALEPLTVARGKNLVIELADSGGGRHLLLKIKGRMVLRARMAAEEK